MNPANGRLFLGAYRPARDANTSLLKTLFVQEAVKAIDHACKGLPCCMCWGA